MRWRVLARLLAATTTTALLVIVFAAYAHSRGASETPSPEIIIGAVYPLTGASSSAGSDIKDAILLAQDVINAKRPDLDLPLARSTGLDNLGNAKIRFVFGDSKSSPSGGESATRALIEREKAVALLGSYQSAVTEKASQVAESSRIPFLNPESTAPSLTKRNFNWFFRTTPDETVFVSEFFDFLKEVQEERRETIERIGIIHENSIFGSEVAALEESLARKMGYRVVANISYDANRQNAPNEAIRLESVDPDVVLQTSFADDAIRLVGEYKRIDFRPEGILGDDAGFIEPKFLSSLGKSADFLLTRETWAKDVGEKKPLAKKVNDLFRARYGRDMNGNSARAFTGALVLVDAINRAGTTNPEAIRRALMETDISGSRTIMPWDGIRFDAKTHQNVLGKGIIVQILNREYRTVWPSALASTKLVWPMPKLALPLTP